MDGLIALKWIIDIVKTFSNVWGWLSTPLFTIGDFTVSFLGLFSTTLIVAILSFKIIDLVIPV